MEFTGLQIAAGATNLLVTDAPLELNVARVPTLAAIAASGHGSTAGTASATTGRLTLAPGVWKIDASLSLAGIVDAGSANDAVGELTLHVYRAGATVAGLKAKGHTQTATQQFQLGVHGLVEISQALADAGTNYVSMYLDATDSGGNDVLITEGQFIATRMY